MHALVKQVKGVQPKLVDKNLHFHQIFVDTL